MKIKISILIITLSITGVIMAPSAEMSIPYAFSQLLESENNEKNFLLRVRIIIKDKSTEQVEIKFKSEDVAQKQIFDKGSNDSSKKRFKFKFIEEFNSPYEICAESAQNKDIYACKGGILYTLRPNVTLYV
ncbi:MAG: hypothetical protein ACPKPY_06250 [Nitrososphaeraceae archaeon]